MGGMENYFEFYKETALAVKSISSALRVGGPGIAYQTVMETGWLEEFLQYTVTWQVPLDFVSDTDKEITLVTCHPMINPTHRLIVKGELERKSTVDNKPKLNHN